MRFFVSINRFAGELNCRGSEYYGDGTAGDTKN